MENEELALQRARIFIAKHTWKFAKTMPWVPHWYIVKTKLSEEDQKEFDWFVEASRKYGINLRWGKKPPKPYWFIDEYKYWTMMAPIEETIIINRGKHDV
jgi:hypothetical protein